MIHETIKLPYSNVTLTTYVQDDIGTYGTENGRKPSSFCQVVPMPSFVLLKQNLLL